MAVRVMTYIGLLWQDLARSDGLNPDGTLPPVLPLVLYNGEAPWSGPRAIHAAMGPVPRLLAPYQPESSFLLLDEVRMHLREGHERNLAAAVFRLERLGTPAEHVAIARLTHLLQLPLGDVVTAMTYDDTAPVVPGNPRWFSVGGRRAVGLLLRR